MFRFLTLVFLSVSSLGCSHMKKLEFKDLPSLGRSSAGQEIFLGGFSGVQYLGKNSEGHYRFVTHTDRGPNGDMYNGNRPFLLPDYIPRWVYFNISPNFKDVIIEKTVLLKNKEENLSGLPPVAGLEDPVDVYDYLLPTNPHGIDPECITQDGQGHFWMGDEYFPSLLEFSAEGVLLNRLLPTKDFPALFAQRRLNRGFEGMTYFKNNLWVFLESPLKAGPTDMKGPILIFDPVTKKSIGVKYYPFDTSSADKIGDVAAFKDLGLFVIERSNVLGSNGERKIYFMPDPSKDGPIKKRLIVDLAKIGLDDVEKIEGLTVVEDRYLVLMNDNDFGLSGRPDYLKTGLVPTKAEGSYIYILDLNSLLPKNWKWDQE